MLLLDLIEMLNRKHAEFGNLPVRMCDGWTIVGARPRKGDTYPADYCMPETVLQLVTNE